ncbi:hypothetical protein SERLADRAFT_466392, partial [Serpula lacrymans var. lacrymans S7.9]
RSYLGTSAPFCLIWFLLGGWVCREIESGGGLGRVGCDNGRGCRKGRSREAGQWSLYALLYHAFEIAFCLFFLSLFLIL